MKNQLMVCLSTEFLSIKDGIMEEKNYINWIFCSVRLTSITTAGRHQGDAYTSLSLAKKSYYKSQNSFLVGDNDDNSSASFSGSAPSSPSHQLLHN